MNMNMSTTFLHRALLTQNHFSRISCILPRRYSRIGIHASVRLPEAAARALCCRPVFARAFQVSQFRPVSQLSIATPPSVLQFVSSTVWKATHRSGGASSRTRWPSQPPRPPSLWERIRDAVNAIPHNVIFWGILVVNGIVYITWNYAYGIYASAGDPSLYVWMNDNFTGSLRNFRAGRLWTIITSCFSHERTGHLFFNAFTYYFMAPPILAALGNMGFLGLYLGGGIFSSVFTLVWSHSVKHRDISQHGASGALYSVITFFACIAPRTKFYLFAILPVPAWLLVGGVFLVDGFSAVYDKQQGTNTAGHIGGILGGIVYFLAKRYRIF